MFKKDELKKAAMAELKEELSKEVVADLKELYAKREDAALILKNIDKEIEDYLETIEEKAVYKAAGLKVVDD